jgi:hypothetical protein
VQFEMNTYGGNLARVDGTLLGASVWAALGGLRWIGLVRPFTVWNDSTVVTDTNWNGGEVSFAFALLVIQLDFFRSFSPTTTLSPKIASSVRIETLKAGMISIVPMLALGLDKSTVCFLTLLVLSSSIISFSAVPLVGCGSNPCSNGATCTSSFFLFLHLSSF